MTAVIRGAVALFGTYFFRLPKRSDGRELCKPEEILTTRCVDFLRLAAPQDLFFTHVPNEAPRHVVGHFIQEAMGRQVGMPDLHLLFRGKAFYVEIKTPGKKPTAEQLNCMERIIAAGGRCAWVDNFDDFVGQMIAWKIVD